MIRYIKSVWLTNALGRDRELMDGKVTTNVGGCGGGWGVNLLGGHVLGREVTEG